jgi:hypothetical protein
MQLFFLTDRHNGNAERQFSALQDMFLTGHYPSKQSIKERERHGQVVRFLNKSKSLLHGPDERYNRKEPSIEVACVFRTKIALLHFSD